MRVLVTGATGFIGQHLVVHLLQGGHTVTVLVRETYGMGRPFPRRLAGVRPRFNAVYADLRNLALTRRAVQEAQPEAVVHLAAAGVTNPYLDVDRAMHHNVTGTLNLLRSTFENSEHPRQMVVARTPGERAPSTVYHASKAAAWQFCTMYAASQEWPIHGAMIFQAYGPGQPGKTLVPSATRAALAGESFPMTSGKQERDWIYIDDVVRGVAQALVSPPPPGATLELGTGVATSVAAVVSKIYALVNAGGKPQPGMLTDRRGEAQRQVAQPEPTRSLLGWEPACSLEEGLQQTIAAESW
ncbi:MAG TPA: SDR family NAD(P)-dependent oxidoreductase [Candidatus Sulfomarinibacteraceae bacterium]|nr:SDR family NAD(P)-dependent oxidoreductase [Candidatus Sulfomarinibacteraceae bacterium]